MCKWSKIEKIEKLGFAMWLIAAFLMFFTLTDFIIPHNSSLKMVFGIIIIVLAIVGGLLLIAECHLVRKNHIEWQRRYEEGF